MLVEKYFGNNAMRLEKIEEIKKGNLYAVGCGSHGFRAFISLIDGNHSPDTNLEIDTKFYEAHLDNSGEEIIESEVKKMKLTLDDFIDVQILGLHRLEKGKLKDKILKELSL